MYVTVEAGCTWKQLAEALAPRGLRTPYWGPVSGRRATVGGALSQNSMFWGAVQYGCAAENVLGLDVVLADGSLLSTGSHSGLEGGVPFFRHYGPDLTGLFTSDCGALAVKVRATLPLLKIPSHRGVLSFGFPDVPTTLAFLAGVSQGKLITESAGFDQSQQEQRVARRKLGLKESLALFASIVRSKGVAAALRTGIGRGRALRTIKSSAHVMIETDGAPLLAQRLAQIREIAITHDGWEIEPSIPTVLQAEPFPSPSMMLGPEGEAFVPHHGIVPHSRSVAASAEIAALFATYAERCKSCALRTGLFFSAFSNSSIVLEPTWYWEDMRNSFHNTAIEPEKRAQMKDFPDNPDARRLVDEMRGQVEAIFQKHGAAHFQIGKYYPYAESRDAFSHAALTQIKRQFDPKNIMNPGALGW
jgi:FAD/FMN-containing dehydrogenase